MDYRLLGFMTVFLVGTIIYLQYFLAKKSIKALRVEGCVDMKLVSPGEIVTLNSTVTNIGHIPIMYVNKFEDFSSDINIEESDEWKKKYLSNNIIGHNTKYRFFILPHEQINKYVHISFAKRGVFEFGKYYIETGDFLGINSSVKIDNYNLKVVVIPDYCSDEIILEAIGGFLGEISVRRFIMEDPILNIGYRDYTGCEPMKNISWLQTARVGRLQVKEPDHTVDMNVSIIFNMETTNKNHVEKCFTILRTVCEELEKKHYPYEVFSNGDIHNLSEGLGVYHLNSIMERAGKSECNNYYSLEKLINESKKTNRNYKSYIVITPPLSENQERIVQELKANSMHEICVLIGRGSEDE